MNPSSVMKYVSSCVQKKLLLSKNVKVGLPESSDELTAVLEACVNKEMLGLLLDLLRRPLLPKDEQAPGDSAVDVDHATMLFED